jgi:hypothetical protein
MHHKIDVIQEHPLRLFVTLGMSDAQAQGLQPLIDRVGNRLNLARIRPRAHHKIIGKRSRIFFQFEHGYVVSLFILAGEDGFVDLDLQFIFFLHTIARLYPASQGRYFPPR